MNMSKYLTSMNKYLDNLLSKDLPYFPLSFEPRDLLSRNVIENTQYTSLKDIVLNHSRIAIVGSPGAGKTRAARDLAKVFCCSLLLKPQSEEPIPIYIPLRHLRGQIDNGKRWSDLIIDPLNFTLIEFDCHFEKGEQLTQLLSGKRFILLIDGLNEIHNHEMINVMNILETCPDNAHIVLTSRIREYPTEYIKYAVYDIRPLSFPNEVQGFLNTQNASPATLKSIIDRCELDAILRQLATNPYLLTQMFHVTNEGFHLPDDRTSLLDLVVDNLIKTQSLDGTIIKTLLMNLAGEMQFERQVLKMYVGEIVSRPLCSIKDLERLKNILSHLIDMRLLVRYNRSLHNTQNKLQDNEEVGFHHQVFQEFFAGKYLYGQQLTTEKPVKALKIILHYGKSRWNWESICTAVVLLTMEGRQTAWVLIKWLVRSNPNLTALIQSEVPLREREATEYYLQINERLIKKLKNNIVFWALWMPHCYNFLPVMLIGGILTMTWSVLNLTVSSGISSQLYYFSQGLPLLIIFSLLIPLAYTIMLTAIYKWFDNVIFDRKVHPSLASLELLRFRGGRETLCNIRQRAEANFFIGNRMKIWILSSPKIPLVDVHEKAVLKGKVSGIPESRKDITDDWVKCLTNQLFSPHVEKADRLLIIRTLTAALRILGSEERLHIEIRNSLYLYLRQGAKGRVRRHVIAALGDESRPSSFLIQVFRHWRRHPGIWIFFAASAVITACATYFKWPLIISIMAYFLSLIGFLSDINGIYQSIASNQNKEIDQ